VAADRIERQLADLGALRALDPEAVIAPLRKALRDRVNVIVAKAASISAELHLRALLPDLLAAFERLFDKPRETDPQCRGKNAIAKALKDLDHSESTVFLRGSRHIQMEPVWNGQVDTAGVLRGTCVLALAQCADITRDETLLHLIDAVTETESTVRRDATLALEQMAGREAVSILRMKARTGDEEPEVTGQVFASLLRLDPGPSVTFVGRFLEDKKEQTIEEAALALGASRLSQALETLKEVWKKSKNSAIGPVLLRAISISRLDDAFEFLLAIVREGRQSESADALRALEIHRDSPPSSNSIRRRVEEALARMARKS
jgi:HEAT repeat protein